MIAPTDPRVRFLGIEPPHCEYSGARFAVLPVPYEGGVSYGAGAAGGPDAILAASQYLELYDEELDAEPYKAGITTLDSLDVTGSPEAMESIVYSAVRDVFNAGKIPVVLGGDHSVTCGAFRACHDVYPDAGVIQLDAHADLRDVYEGSRLSHACVMARLREVTQSTLQLGIRSMSSDEAGLVRSERLSLCTMGAWRRGDFCLDTALRGLPEQVYVTIDVDVLDWSVVRSTGTPEPGGFLWNEATGILQDVARAKTVVGFDVVELSADGSDRNSAFAAAKLVYKLIGFLTA